MKRPDRKLLAAAVLLVAAAVSFAGQPQAMKAPQASLASIGGP